MPRPQLEMRHVRYVLRWAPLAVAVCGIAATLEYGPQPVADAVNNFINTKKTEFRTLMQGDSIGRIFFGDAPHKSPAYLPPGSEPKPLAPR